MRGRELAVQAGLDATVLQPSAAAGPVPRAVLAARVPARRAPPPGALPALMAVRLLVVAGSVGPVPRLGGAAASRDLPAPVGAGDALAVACWAAGEAGSGARVLLALCALVVVPAGRRGVGRARCWGG
ncbi:hypothetical protein Nans01_06530 [Nocardiopsis ansamitocini]|uniref:Uncharacterized protein n=1 Tax=Nocardiopsis ansamitocini TaxID=1670832 RepID=A0A9W6P397_9ACTN|nr:hypothetical protein Nans01_06530 [Nocardiopsis ansamitocini]